MQICGFFCRRLRGCLAPSSSLALREELIVFAYQIWKPQFLSVGNFRSTTAIRRSLRQRFLK